jgi:CRP-like cAMP-binding protein
MPDKITLNEGTFTVLRQTFRLAGFSPDLKAEEVSTLFPNSRLFEYAPDEHIIEQDEAGKDLYVLCVGKVNITKTFGSAGMTLATLEQGAVFGEMALLRDGIRVATAVAQTRCRVFRIAAQDAEALLKSRPQLGAMLQQLAAQRS